jgi:hypothetical protein
MTIEFLLFIKSQFTTDVKHVLHLNTAFVIMDCRTILKAASGCEYFNRHKKCVGKMSLHFESGLNTLGFWSVPRNKTLKDLGQYVVGLYLGNCLRTYIDMDFCPCFAVGNSFCSLSVHFRYTVYIIKKTKCLKTSIKFLCWFVVMFLIFGLVSLRCVITGVCAVGHPPYQARCVEVER